MRRICIIFYFSAFLLMTFSMTSSAYTYVNGNYRTISNGNWTNVSIWNVYSSGTWVVTGSIPTSTDTVFVAHTVTYDMSLKSCYTLTIEPSGILYTLSVTNAYLNVHGNIICDGQIGNGSTFDGIGFNLEGLNDTISGSGVFDAARIRKTYSFNTTTNLFINMSVTLRFTTGNNTQIYNNSPQTFFNVTLAANDTLNLTGSGPNSGSAAINGTNGAGTNGAGGTFTINGVMYISGTLYHTTADTNSSPRNACKWIIGSTGYISVRGGVNCTASSLSTDSLILRNGGTLELTGIDTTALGYPFYPFSITNNGISIASNSTVIYSGAGNQRVRVASEFGTPASFSLYQYGNLILKGSGNKNTSTDLYVKNNITIIQTAVLNPSLPSSQLFLGGNWSNYSETGFNEQTTTVRINGVPTTDATQFATQYITCTGGEVFHILSLNKTSTPNALLVFNSPVDIKSNLQFATNGAIDLNSNLLTIRNTAATGIQGATKDRYIISEKTDNSSMIKWKIGIGTGTYTFPFGVSPGGTSNYVPIKIVKAASDIGDVTAATYGTGQGNLPWPTIPVNVTNLNKYPSIAINDSDAVVDRFFYFSATNSVATDLTLQYRSVAELPVVPYNTATLIQAQPYNVALNAWRYPPVGTTVGAAVTISANTTYGVWALVNNTAPLPIELLDFNAALKDAVVLVNWTTATEINNQYFTVEKSKDAKNFIEAGIISGAGNSSTVLSYSLIDENPLSGISYYRLKQTDFDGHFSYSKIVPVNMLSNQQISMFPNPSRDIMYIGGAEEGRFHMIIKNMEGKLIREMDADLNPTELYPLNISELAQGIYSLEIINDLKTETLRMIKN